jgi:hypothetical protein
MKRRMAVIVGGVLVGAALALASLGGAFAQQAQPEAGSGYAPGMIGGSGPTGMMGGGAGGMMGSAGQVQAQPLASLDAAKVAFQRYLDATGNKDLVLDEVMQFEWNYYAIVKEKNTGNGAFELLADPHTGAVFPELGPNMMWNTKYSPMATQGGGMMGGFGGFVPGGMMSGTWGPSAPSAQPTVGADQAQQITQQWLDQNQAGDRTETRDAFPGYYTLHVTNDGTITGMLSVNAYTGQVWYHTWHGAFVVSTDAGT